VPPIPCACWKWVKTAAPSAWAICKP
jgi:hypothetical protein